MQVTSDKGTPGAKVVEVVQGGAAATAGVPKDVVVTKVDDRPINSADALVAAVRSKAPGDKVSLTYQDPNGGEPHGAGHARQGGAVMRVDAPLSDLGYTVAPMEKGAELVVGRALVVVVDDRTAHGDEDHSGPLVTELLTEAGFVVDGVVAVAADEVEIRNALNTAVIGGVDLVVSVGGTGVTPRDVTPEATRDILDREILGIAEAIRASGLSAGIIDAGLSRGLAGRVRKHAGGQPRRVPLRGARRDGDAESAGRSDHRAVVEPGDLSDLIQPPRIWSSASARGP